MVKVNAVGMVCPLPVIETRKALKENEQVETTVDNKVATENLRRMAAQMGYEYDLKEEGADRFVVTITKTLRQIRIRRRRLPTNLSSSLIPLLWGTVPNSSAKTL